VCEDKLRGQNGGFAFGIRMQQDLALNQLKVWGILAT
jgi:hypothetical protein